MLSPVAISKTSFVIFLLKRTEKTSTALLGSAQYSNNLVRFLSWPLIRWSSLSWRPLKGSLWEGRTRTSLLTRDLMYLQLSIQSLRGFEFGSVGNTLTFEVIFGRTWSPDIKSFNLNDVKKISMLLSRSEYKRFQSAPGPKVTEKAFGRDRRYPLTSGFRNWN